MYPKYFTVDFVAVACNNKCRHCYSKIPNPIRRLSYRESVILLEEINKSTLSEFVMCPWCLMHDPLLIKDWDSLVIYIKEHWTKCKKGDSLVSNLSAITQDSKVMDKLHKVGIKELQFSFYGIGETHDWFAGRKGAYRDIEKALPILQNAGIKLRPVIWLHRKIGSDLPLLMDKFNHFGLDLDRGKLPAHIIDPVGHQLSHPEDRPTREGLIAHADLLPTNIFLWEEGIVCKNVLNGLTMDGKNKACKTAGSSFDKNRTEDAQINLMCSYTILPDGEAYPFWEPAAPLFRLGNVFVDGMDEIHRRYYNGDYEGKRLLENLDSLDLISKYGNVISTKLYSDPESLMWEYKVKYLKNHN
jgi:MoaA/NifB/PqqE/SkfB family radical SAM enzyme